MNRFKKVEKVKRERERKKSENLIEKRERDLQMLEGNERESVSCVIAQTL